MWGCSKDDVRGNLLVDLVASLDLTTCNTSSSFTYVRYSAQLIINVTFTRLELGAEVKNWRVRLDLNSESDHRYITYDISRGAQFGMNGPHVARDWMASNLDWTELRIRLANVPKSSLF